jgi:8-oxo-dGTP diphosphatase
MTIGRFLGGVAALIWEPDTGKYLLLRRAGSKDFKSGEWECVTGRVDQGESYTQALLREVREEIGVEARIEFIIGLSHFYRGQELPENELLGVIFGCTISRQDVTIGEEHSEMLWASASEIEAMLPDDHWLRRAVSRCEHLRRLLPEALRQEFKLDGFELG